MTPSSTLSSYEKQMFSRTVGEKTYKSGGICLDCGITADNKDKEWSQCTIIGLNGNPSKGHNWNRNPIII